MPTLASAAGPVVGHFQILIGIEPISLRPVEAVSASKRQEGERAGNLPMSCKIDIDLLGNFTKATARYFAAVNELTAIIAEQFHTSESFLDCYNKAQREHENCKRALKAIQQHRLEHHCLLSSVTC